MEDIEKNMAGESETMQTSPENKTGKDHYDADDINVLEGLKHVRKRPGMYIGTTDIDGLHHLVYEVLDNSIDEAMVPKEDGGCCNHITIIFDNAPVGPDGSEAETCTVIDNGRGIPVKEQAQLHKSALEVCLTHLNAGGKFKQGAYTVSGGLHGVGVSCVNALSCWMEATVKRNGKLYHQVYHTGIPEEDVKVIGTCPIEETGTTISFSPDFEIMDKNSFNYDTLSARFRELAFLNKGLKISIIDRRGPEERKEEFLSEGGIKEYVEYLNSVKTTLFPAVSFECKKDDVIVEAALQYNDKFDEKFLSFVNNINTREGGTHLSGFKNAVLNTLNKQLNKSQKLLKEYGNDKFDSSDICEGLTGIVSVKLKEPQFEGQTKMKLGNKSVYYTVSSLITERLTNFFDENPDYAEKVLNKAVGAAKARKAAQTARENIRKQQSTGGGLPGKLADCSSKDPAECEIFIVEGDSAGGSAKQGRDRRNQAILSLWGKMLNVEKSPEFKVLGNDKLQPVIASIGAGLTRYNNQARDGEDEAAAQSLFDITKARYHKIIIMADADVDGSHIRTLLLTFFFRYMRPLIDAGYIYFAMPPLYKITIGKRDYYAFDEADRDKIIAEHAAGADVDKLPIQRYKGLGEMNPDQLWDTTMNPETRHISQVHLSDAEEADRVFSMLMGEDVEPRRDFIETNAINATIDA